MLGNRWLFSPLEPHVNQSKDAFVLFATFCYACLFVLIHPKPVQIKVKRSCVSVLSVSLPVCMSVCLSGCRESPVRAPPPAAHHGSPSSRQNETTRVWDGDLVSVLLHFTREPSRVTQLAFIGKQGRSVWVKSLDWSCFSLAEPSSPDFTLQTIRNKRLKD